MNIFDLITGKIALGMIVGLSVLIYAQAWQLDILEEKLSTCQTTHKATQLLIQANKTHYATNIKYYDAAINDTVIFYEDQLIHIDNFKGETHETICQTSKRLFDQFKY
ncbi:MAG: hypothetical protein Q9M36_05665 [Sulfurovum sp.]|nr:hypothetical protein [Sulfurovum sp.]